MLWTRSSWGPWLWNRIMYFPIYRNRNRSCFANVSYSIPQIIIESRSTSRNLIRFRPALQFQEFIFKSGKQLFWSLIVHFYLNFDFKSDLFPLFSSSENLSWTVGSGRNTFLWFHCAALANPPSEPPAGAVHMTYKFMQAETRLLSALLINHGLREVRNKKVQEKILPYINNHFSGKYSKLSWLPETFPKNNTVWSDKSSVWSRSGRDGFRSGYRFSLKNIKGVELNKGKWWVVNDYSCDLFDL